MATHRLEAAPETVHWGFFDAKLPPQLTIDSGDTVTITTVSGTLGYLPKPSSGLTVPPALQAIHDKVQAKIGGPHILTGPVAVRGAKAVISREDAYTLCSLAADLRVTQVVNGAKGIHVMLEKKLLQRAR